MAHASARPDSHYHGRVRPGTALGRAGRGNSSRRCGLVLARREALAWCRAGDGHDAHRHSGEERQQGGRLDGTCQRRTIPRREIKEVSMSNKPTQNDTLKARLSRSREIHISVTGRKSGRTISNPVWFVLDEDKLYLLPVQGSDTQWYKNVLKNPMIKIKAGGAEAEFRAIPLFSDIKQVTSVVEKFREKYGANDVKKYYSKFDVAVVAHAQ